jgi:hypothetical protein
MLKKERKEIQMHINKQEASGGELSPSAAVADRHTDALWHVLALMLQ